MELKKLNYTGMLNENETISNLKYLIKASYPTDEHFIPNEKNKRGTKNLSLTITPFYVNPSLKKLATL